MLSPFGYQRLCSHLAHYCGRELPATLLLHYVACVRTFLTLYIVYRARSSDTHIASIDERKICARKTTNKLFCINKCHRVSYLQIKSVRCTSKHFYYVTCRSYRGKCFWICFWRNRFFNMHNLPHIINKNNI